MKIFILGLFVLIFSLNIFGNKVFASVDIPTTTSKSQLSSFELFWPIVSGKVQGDYLYSLKLFKEKIREVFIFSYNKKAEYYLFISTKRLVEFENLVLVKKDFGNATTTLGNFINIHKKVIMYVDKAKNKKIDVTESSQIIANTIDKQLLLLTDIYTKVDDSQKTIIKSSISFLDSELKELQ